MSLTLIVCVPAEIELLCSLNGVFLADETQRLADPHFDSIGKCDALLELGVLPEVPAVGGAAPVFRAYQKHIDRIGTIAISFEGPILPTTSPDQPSSSSPSDDVLESVSGSSFKNPVLGHRGPPPPPRPQIPASKQVTEPRPQPRFCFKPTKVLVGRTSDHTAETTQPTLKPPSPH